MNEVDVKSAMYLAEDISVWWLGPRRFVTLVRSAVYKSSYLLTYLAGIHFQILRTASISACDFIASVSLCSFGVIIRHSLSIFVDWAGQVIPWISFFKFPSLMQTWNRMSLIFARLFCEIFRDSWSFNVHPKCAYISLESILPWTGNRVSTASKRSRNSHLWTTPSPSDGQIVPGFLDRRRFCCDLTQRVSHQTKYRFPLPSSLPGQLCFTPG